MTESEHNEKGEAQSASEGREQRSSMLLSAAVQSTSRQLEVVVRVRNISSGGLMAEAPHSFQRGETVRAELRGVGAVEGRVAWVSSNRFGIEFNTQIDPQLTLKPVAKTTTPSIAPSAANWRPGFRPR